MIAAAGVEQLRACFGAALDDTLPKHLTRLGWDNAQLVRHQRQRLQIILEQARERSPFHAARFRGIDLSAVDVNDLSALPVMTKADMMYAYDQVPTDRRLTRAAIEDHLARSSQTPSALFGNFVCLASGGSSGERASSSRPSPSSPSSSPRSCGERSWRTHRRRLPASRSRSR